MLKHQHTLKVELKAGRTLPVWTSQLFHLCSYQHIFIFKWGANNELIKVCLFRNAYKRPQRRLERSSPLSLFFLECLPPPILDSWSAGGPGRAVTLTFPFVSRYINPWSGCTRA